MSIALFCKTLCEYVGYDYTCYSNLHNKNVIVFEFSYMQSGMYYKVCQSITKFEILQARYDAIKLYRLRIINQMSRLVRSKLNERNN